MQTHELFAAYLRGCRLGVSHGTNWWDQGPIFSICGAGTRHTSFITGMSAACVQKQSCTETKVRPFLSREIPSEVASCLASYCLNLVLTDALSSASALGTLPGFTGHLWFPIALGSRCSRRWLTFPQTAVGTWRIKGKPVCAKDS